MATEQSKKTMKTTPLPPDDYLDGEKSSYKSGDESSNLSKRELGKRLESSSYVSPKRDLTDSPDEKHAYGSAAEYTSSSDTSSHKLGSTYDSDISDENKSHPSHRRDSLSSLGVSEDEKYAEHTGDKIKSSDTSYRSGRLGEYEKDSRSHSAGKYTDEHKTGSKTAISKDEEGKYHDLSGKYTYKSGRSDKYGEDKYDDSLERDTSDYKHKPGTKKDKGMVEKMVEGAKEMLGIHPSTEVKKSSRESKRDSNKDKGRGY